MKTTRILEISADMFVEFCKAPPDDHRTYTVSNPLPADAKLISVDLDRLLNVVRCEVESGEWFDASPPNPSVTIHWEPSR